MLFFFFLILKNVFYKQNENPKTKNGLFIYLEDINEEVEETITKRKLLWFILQNDVILKHVLTTNII